MAEIETEKHENNDPTVVKVCVISLDDCSQAFESIPHRGIVYWCEENFICDEVAVSKFVGSYLVRDSFALNEFGQPSHLIKKQYLNRSSPQGSILSPFFWRIYDLIFSEIYEDLLIYAAEVVPEISKFNLENFADDKYTALHLLFKKGTDVRTIGERINAILILVRELLIEATTAVGCSINPSKSESIVDHRFVRFVKEGKSDFVWLGYSLGLNSKYELIFTANKLNQSIESTRRLVDKIFIYTDKIYLKYKVFMVYVIPIIEIFLPLAISNNRFQKILESFQHSMVCKILGVNFRCSAEKCRELLEVTEIEVRMLRCADRLVKFENVEWEMISQKRAKKFIERSNLSLRSGRRLTAKEYDRLDFVGRVVELGNKKIPKSKKPNIDFGKVASEAKAIRRKQAMYKKKGKIAKK